MRKIVAAAAKVLGFKMILECGLEPNTIKFNFSLPTQSLKIGVLVSGGLDSALLYYLCQKENKNLNLKHNIIPITIQRDTETVRLAQAVVDSVHDSLSLRIKSTRIIPYGNNYTVDNCVYNGAKTASEIVDQVFIGLTVRSKFYKDVKSPFNISDSDIIKFPIRKLQKYHVVDLCYQFNQQNLFHLTNSCFINDIGRCNKCAGCLERKWGFDQLNKQDPGGI